MEATLSESLSDEKVKEVFSYEDLKQARTFGYILGVLLLVIGCLVGALTTVLITDVDKFQMPCAEGQVGVWQNYPDEVRCVSEDEHGEHAGN